MLFSGNMKVSPWTQPPAPVRPHQLPYQPVFEKKGFDVYILRMNRDVNRPYLQRSLFRLFKSHVLLLHLSVENDMFGNVNGHVVVPSRNDIRKLIKLFQKLPFFGRILEFSEINPNLPVPISFKYEDGLDRPLHSILCFRRAVIHVFEEQKRTKMLLIDVMRRFEEKYDLSLGALDIMKMQDLVERYVEDGSQMIRLLPAALTWQANIVRQGCLEDLQSTSCALHGTPPSSGSASKMISCYRVTLREFSQQVRKLLRIHGGTLNLTTFVDCFEKEFGPLVEDDVGGMYLEHLLTAVPGVRIRQMPYESRSLVLDHECDPNAEDSMYRGRSQGNLQRFLVEVRDMLMLERRSAVPFGEFVQSYRTNYDKMCRVADFGCTRLIDLLMLLEKDIHVIGTGINRIIMLAHSVQLERFKSLINDIKIKCPGHRLNVENFSALHKYTFKRPFVPNNFGVCFAEDLLEMVGITVPAIARPVLQPVSPIMSSSIDPVSSWLKEDDSGIFSHKKASSGNAGVVDLDLIGCPEDSCSSDYVDSLDGSYSSKLVDTDESMSSSAEGPPIANKNSVHVIPPPLDNPTPQPIISRRLAMRFS